MGLPNLRQNPIAATTFSLLPPNKVMLDGIVSTILPAPYPVLIVLLKIVNSGVSFLNFLIKDL